MSAKDACSHKAALGQAHENFEQINIQAQKRDRESIARLLRPSDGHWMTDDS